MAGKTYIIGKIGKSVKFNPNTWTGLGGDVEAPTLFKKLAELNSDDTFVIISGNDLDKSREKMKMPDNLYSIYDGCTKEERKDPSFIYNRLKDIKIDGCFLMSGPTGSTNIVDKSYIRKELAAGNKVFAKVLDVFKNYVQQMYVFLNESNIPWTLIVNDPRYTQQGRDLTNPPKKIISQFNEKVVLKHFKSFEDQLELKHTEIDAIYSGIEKMFLIDSKKPSKEQFEKTIKLMIPLNEGTNGVKSRYDELKKYVLDYIDDVEIYGKWEDSIMESDNRFKGTMPYHELQSALDKVKYSFMISISDGWVTMKVWELISHGVIPFMHPGYDTQKSVKVPDFVRIKSPEDLHNKIEMLENDNALYESVLQECIDLITQDDISGVFLSNMIFENMMPINKSGLEYKDTYQITKEINGRCDAGSLDDW